MSRKRRDPRSAPAIPRDPYAGTWLQEGLVLAIAAKLVGVILVVDPLGLQAFELPKALFSRALAWPIAGLLLASVVTYGAAILPRHRLHAFVAFFALTNLISALFAPVQYVALYGERGSYLGLTFVLDMLVLYAAVAVGMRRATDWWIVGGASAIAVLLSVAYAALQFLGLDPLRWDASGRPFGTLGGTVRFAHLLGVVFAAGLGLALFAPPGRRQRLQRAGGVALALIAVVAAGAAGSRGIFVGVGAALAGLLVVGWFSRRFSTRRALQLAVVVALLGGGAVALLLTTPAGQRAGARLAEFAAEERLLIYQAAVELIRARPVVGFGPDSFTVGYTAHRPVSTAGLGADVIENSAHNWVLQAAATTGALGMIALLALLVAWVRTLLGAAKQGSALGGGVLFAGGMAYWAQGLVSVGTVSVDWFAWLALGATVSLAGVTREGSRPSLRVPTWGPVLLVALFVLPMPFGLVAVSANRAALSSSSAYRSENSEIAIEEATRAVRADAGRADHWNWLGLALTLAQRWKDSGDAFAEAASRAPYDSTYWHNLARSRTLQTLSGDRTSGGSDAAIAAARKGIAVEPSNAASYLVTAEIAFSLGHPDLALRTAIDAARKGVPMADATILKAAKVMTDLPAARRLLDELVMLQDAPGIRLGLAHVALKMNDLEAARDNARRVLEIVPTSAEAREILIAAGGR